MDNVVRVGSSDALRVIRIPRLDLHVSHGVEIIGKLPDLVGAGRLPRRNRFVPPASSQAQDQEADQ